MNTTYFNYFPDRKLKRNRWKSTNAWHKKCGSRLKTKEGEDRYLCKHCNEYIEPDSKAITHDFEYFKTKKKVTKRGIKC